MLSRRRFVAGVASGLVLSEFARPISLQAATSKLKLSEARRAILLAALKKEDRRFDPFARMLVTSAPRDSQGLPAPRMGDVHSTRISLAYAAASLEAGEPWRTDRAKEILRVVLSLQDGESTSPTYGQWLRYLKEPTQTSPIHWSSSFSCALSLLMARIYHRADLGEPLSTQIEEAILHTARSWQRHELPFAQTSVSLAGSGLILLAGQEFKLPDLRASGKAQFKKVYDHLMRRGFHAEYNSPPDSIAVLQELSRMLLLLRDARDRSLVSALHDLAWQHVATHFHPPTQQWAGPHSRNDETDLRRSPATLAFLQTACGSKARFAIEDPPPLSLEAALLPLECPRKWIKYFVQLDEPRPLIETFVRAEPAQPGARTPLIGTTWLHPRLTLGSINRGDLWSQRRPLIAYWGTPDAPRSLRLRCLKNGDDFASALIFSAQHESALLAVVTFATDHGDTHPSLDPVKDATVSVKDLRLRFEFGGELGKLTADTRTDAEKYILLQDRDVRFILRPVADAFGPDRFQWDSPELQLTQRIDSVAYVGEEKRTNLSTLNEAFVCFTLEEWPFDLKAPPLSKVTHLKNDGRLRARWSTRGKTLDLDVPVRPAGSNAMNDSFRSRVV